MSEIAGSIGPSNLNRLVATRLYTPKATARTDHAPRQQTEGAEPQPDSIPFYTNPAARNEAATAIALGRTLDLKG